MNKQAASAIGGTIAGILLLFIISCKEEKKKEEPKSNAKFFPVIPYIKSQVAHVDTSLYSIRVVTPIDSLRNDTTYIRREQFADAARDFLSLPDISKPDYADRYTETDAFDETISRAQLLYTPIKVSDDLIKSQQVTIKPDPSGDKVVSIYITTSINTKDSLVEKKLLWLVDQSFQVTTIRQLMGQPEVTTTYKVVWNEDE
jgi:hypothetical protein